MRIEVTARAEIDLDGKQVALLKELMRHAPQHVRDPIAYMLAEESGIWWNQFTNEADDIDIEILEGADEVSGG